ncbi:MAG: hypothetical protein FWF54_11550 [Candidatus Azobacteroides sp.]|nr:hypothetical protein [Candidatus Azobacteroides sp.]
MKQYNQRIRNPEYKRYRDLNNIDAVLHEKTLLRYRIDQQEIRLSEDWARIKKPFDIMNIAVNFIGFLVSSKKGGWVPILYSGYRTAYSLVNRLLKR